MRFLNGALGALPSHLSCFGKDEGYTYEGPGEEAEYAQVYATGGTLSSGNQAIAEKYGITAPGVSSAGVPQIAVQPSTSSQIFNLVNTVAKGLLDLQKAQAQTKLSTAQAAALADASKVQAQNYVMQQLQQGKQVMVPESWLQKYGASDTWTKWLTPILVIGGVGLLGYAVYLYTKKGGKTQASESKAESTIQGLGSVPSTSLSDADASMAASNPRRRRKSGR